MTSVRIPRTVAVSGAPDFSDCPGVRTKLQFAARTLRGETVFLGIIVDTPITYDIQAQLGTDEFLGSFTGIVGKFKRIRCPDPRTGGGRVSGIPDFSVLSGVPDT